MLQLIDIYLLQNQNFTTEVKAQYISTFIYKLIAKQFPNEQFCQISSGNFRLTITTLVVTISLSYYGMLKQDNKKLNSTVIELLSTQFVFLLIVYMGCQDQKKKAKLNVQNQGANSVCFPPDGTILAASSKDYSIRLSDVKTEEQKAKLESHRGIINSICFSPDGTMLASSIQSREYFIRLWDVKKSRKRTKLDAHNKGVNSVCFSLDGTILASCGQSNFISLWDFKTGQLKTQLDAHTTQVYSICFSPDGTKLVSVDRLIFLWNVKTQQQKAQLNDYCGSFFSVCFSPDGNTLAFGSVDKSVHLWDVNARLKQSKFDGHSGTVCSVCFSLDGTILASGNYDNSIYLWDAETGQQKAKLDGHCGQVQQICFSNDGTTLASGSYDCSIRLWDVKKYNKLNLKISDTKIQKLNLKLPSIKTILLQKLQLILLFSQYPNQPYFKHKELQFLRASLKINQKQILKSQLNKEEVQFWKICQTVFICQQYQQTQLFSQLFLPLFQQALIILSILIQKQIFHLQEFEYQLKSKIEACYLEIQQIIEFSFDRIDNYFDQTIDDVQKNFSSKFKESQQLILPQQFVQLSIKRFRKLKIYQ
ncbi:unnamed protein product [Paramecium sonneborni]|uniref:Uncharacterized protein n=1 Tax=Paramecium sonneborni TaxID=65129 RepID=A0A8S1RN59_9CILI|nr:unnamed protein product [Paramecium sonneborni]